MLALRYVYMLALVIWLGGMVVLGAIVAPTTFAVLQATAPEIGRALAGELFGAILGRFYDLAYGAGAALFIALALMGILGPRPAGFAIRMGVIVVMIAVVLYAGIIVLGEVGRIQSAVGALPSTLAVGDPRRVRFDYLHTLSTRLMQFNLLAALVLLYWEAREQAR
jgi:uncharacterized membrane protein